MEIEERQGGEKMDVTAVNEVSAIIGQLGFPIFVAVWMLMKSSKDNEKMTTAINELKTAIQVMNETKKN